MRILQLAPPWQPVPWASGSEHLIPGVLSDGLVDGGRQVTLVASSASRTRATLLDVVDGHADGRSGDMTTLLPHVLAAYRCRRDNDIVHDHTELGPALATIADNTPTVHTLHYPLTDVRRVYLGQVHPRTALVAVSQAQAGRAPELPIAAVIHPGIRTQDYPLVTSSDGHLAFVGRAHAGASAEAAIMVAHQLGARLRMALDVSTPAEREYWASVLRSRVDGPRLDMVINPERLVRNAFLGGADALLATGDRAEPFSLAAAEANACGTPVVGFTSGALAEVVEDGRNGFLVDAGDIDALCEAAERADWLDRTTCRQHVEERFSATRMIASHHALYGSAVQAACVSPPSRDRLTDPTEESSRLLEWASALLTSAGHDVKGPLTTIVGLTELLVEPAGSLDADDRSRVQEQLLASCRRLRSTLDELLDVRHLMRRAGADRAENVDLVPLIGELAVELDIDDRHLDVDLRVKACWVDRLSLEHILRNLVSNGLRESTGEQAVTVRSFPDPSGTGMTTIAVEDRGPGVPDARKQELLMPTLDQARDGIGLGIVSALTHLDGGHVWVVDRPGGGASFRVSLPPERGMAPAPAADALPEVARTVAL